MWIGVILICATPADARTCDVLVRTQGAFYSQQSCEQQVKTDLTNMLKDRPIYTRYKCYQLKSSV